MTSPKSKTLAFVSDSIYPYNKGGKEMRLYEISTRLAAQGFDVHIYCMQWWKGSKDRIENSVHLHGISAYMPLYDGPRRSIKQGVLFGLACLKLITAKFDVIDVDHMPFFPLYSVKFVCWLRGKPMTATWHEVWGKEYWQSYLGGVKGNVAWLIEKYSLGLPNKIISVSDLTTQRLRKLGVKFPIHTIANGIDLQKIAEVKPSTQKSDIIFAGRFLSHKNLDVLIAAVAELRKIYPQVVCFIIGDGPEKEDLLKQVKKLQLQKNVFLLPFFEQITDLYALMKSSRVFVLPSTREGFGLVVLEANACGIPVVTIDHKDNAARALIKNGVNGELVGLDSNEIRKNVEKLIKKNKKNLFKYMNLSIFDWNENLKSITRVYDSNE